MVQLYYTDNQAQGKVIHYLMIYQNQNYKVLPQEHLIIYLEK